MYRVNLSIQIIYKGRSPTSLRIIYGIFCGLFRYKLFIVKCISLYLSIGNLFLCASFVPAGRVECLYCDSAVLNVPLSAVLTTACFHECVTFTHVKALYTCQFGICLCDVIYKNFVPSPEWSKELTFLLVLLGPNQLF